MATMSLRKVPPLCTVSKIWNDHYTYTVMDTRAITALRTGNLIYKNWNPHKMRPRLMSDMTCLFQPCREPDTMKHVLTCEYYTSKFEEKEGPTRDWATYLVNLNRERIQKFGQPLISTEGWSTIKM